jgi:hypothetical protein
MSENVGVSTSRNPKGLQGPYGDNFTLPELTTTVKAICYYWIEFSNAIRTLNPIYHNYVSKIEFLNFAVIPVEVCYYIATFAMKATIFRAKRSYVCSFSYKFITIQPHVSENFP